MRECALRGGLSVFVQETHDASTAPLPFRLSLLFAISLILIILVFLILVNGSADPGLVDGTCLRYLPRVVLPPNRVDPPEPRQPPCCAVLRLPLPRIRVDRALRIVVRRVLGELSQLCGCKVFEEVVEGGGGRRRGRGRGRFLRRKDAVFAEGVVAVCDRGGLGRAMDQLRKNPQFSVLVRVYGHGGRRQRCMPDSAHVTINLQFKVATRLRRGFPQYPQ